MEQTAKNTSDVLGQVNDAFEDITIASADTFDGVLINAEYTTVHVGTVINIDDQAGIGNINVEDEFDFHVWLCPSKVS